jgi:hypothetical protein
LFDPQPRIESPSQDVRAWLHRRVSQSHDESLPEKKFSSRVNELPTVPHPFSRWVDIALEKLRCAVPLQPAFYRVSQWCAHKKAAPKQKDWRKVSDVRLQQYSVAGDG